MGLELTLRDQAALLLAVLLGGTLFSPLRTVGQEASAPTQVPDIGDTSNSTVQKYLIKGTTEAQLGDHEEAILYFETALDQQSSSPVLLNALANAHHAQGDEPTALFYARKARTHGAERPYYHHRLAELQRQVGQPEAAVETYQDLLARFPNDTTAYRALAEVQAALDRPSAALQTYDRLLEQTPRVPVSVYRKRLSLQRRIGDSRGIEQTLRTLLERRPNSREYRRRLGEHYATSGQPTAALHLLRPLAQQQPDDLELQRRVETLYRKTDRRKNDHTADARSSPKDSANLTALSVAELVQRARSAYDEATGAPAGMDSSRLGKAELLLDRALEQAPTHGDALSLRARLFTEKEAHRQAAQLLDRAVEENPRGPDRWTRAASARLSAYDYAGAAATAEEGLLLFPGHAPLARTAALARLRSGAPTRALGHFEDALDQLDSASDPEETAILRAGLGLAYTHLDRPEDADAAFEQALSLRPDHPRVLRSYAYSLALRQTKLDRALDLARKAVDGASSDPLAHDTLGWVQFQRGNAKAAQQSLQRALNAAPPSSRILEHAGDVEHALGNDEAAQRYWQKALDRSPDRFSLQQKLEETSRP